MTSVREHPTIVQARRRIRNLAACVRRDVTGWVRDRTVAGHTREPGEEGERCETP